MYERLLRPGEEKLNVEAEDFAIKELRPLNELKESSSSDNSEYKGINENF